MNQTIIYAFILSLFTLQCTQPSELHQNNDPKAPLDTTPRILTRYKGNKQDHLPYNSGRPQPERRPSFSEIPSVSTKRPRE